MSGSQIIDLRFYDGNENLVLEQQNKLTKISFLFQNIGPKYLPSISLDLIIPPSIFISQTHKGVGGVPSGSKRRIFLKIKGREIGEFPLKVRVNSKKVFLMEKDFYIHVGDISQQPNSNVDTSDTIKSAITEKETVQKEFNICQKCGAENKANSEFCVYCGQNFKEQNNSKTCPNCGATQLLKAKFCGKCGAKLN
ncbi:MAG: zinc ribbon domain-containing protein [Candidatus Lokiarchaeota archaeon]